MYAGGRADDTARRLARIWAACSAWACCPALGDAGGAGPPSRAGTRFPLGMARLDGQWYLVSMLGERCNWVQNVRAARRAGHAPARSRHACRARGSRQRPAGSTQRYLQQVPGARPHVPSATTRTLPTLRRSRRATRSFAIRDTARDSHATEGPDHAQTSKEVCHDSSARRQHPTTAHVPAARSRGGAGGDGCWRASSR